MTAQTTIKSALRHPNSKLADDGQTSLESSLIRLRPRSKTLYASQGRSVLETNSDGLIPRGTGYGFYVHETRLLSTYFYLIDDEPPQPIAVSNVRQRSFLGYYAIFPPGQEKSEKDQGSGEMEDISEHTLELRISRYVGGGLHEDVDLTNFTQKETRFTLSIAVDADFIDRAELHSGRQQRGKLKRAWRSNDQDQWELDFDYRPVGSSVRVDWSISSGKQFLPRQLGLEA